MCKHIAMVVSIDVATTTAFSEVEAVIISADWTANIASLVPRSYIPAREAGELGSYIKKGDVRSDKERHQIFIVPCTKNRGEQNTRALNELSTGRLP